MPEAWSAKNRAHEIQTDFLFRSCCRRTLSASDNRPTSCHDFFVDTPRGRRYTAHTYGMQQFLYRRMQVLLLRGGHQEVVGDAGWQVARLPVLNNMCWGLVLNHCRAMLLAPGLPRSRSTVGVWAVAFVPF